MGKAGKNKGCQRCGNCCTTLTIAMNNVAADADAQELGRWAALHRCDPLRFPSGCLAVRVPLVCRWLEFDGTHYRCHDYEHRPQICRDYQCDRAKGDKAAG